MRQKIVISVEPFQSVKRKERYCVYIQFPDSEKTMYNNYADSSYTDKKAKWLANMIKVDRVELLLYEDYKNGDIFETNFKSKNGECYGSTKKSNKKSDAETEKE